MCYLRTGGTNKVLTTFIRQKETNSLGNSVQTEIQGITASKSDYHIDNAENQKPATFSLKRKTMEVWHLMIFFPSFFFFLSDGRMELSLKWFDAIDGVPYTLLYTVFTYVLLSWVNY